jgi:hypothetical protein
MVCTTISTRVDGGRFGCAPPALDPAGPGEGGGEGKGCEGEASGSAKNEYAINLEIQSKLAIMSFSLRVSHARRSGSNMSRGRSPP